MSSTPTTLDGEILADRYRLLESIGSGGSSAVYRAWDESKATFRAIKILSQDLADNEKIRKRLLQEAEVMARLQHPNVVTLYTAGVDGDRVYLVMELMPGGSMIERLAEGPLPPKMAAQVLMGVLSALQAAHDAGIVHRDVKPHNILLDADGTPKVSDFGIARGHGGSMTRTGAVLGTLAYMPPEQKLSSRKVDLRADIYAAGATLHALLTGRPPHDLYAAALDDGIARELYAGIPEPVADVIRCATAFRPEARYASASAMAAALAAAVADLPDDPPSVPLVTPSRLGQARAMARLGPTLLGTTESAETTRLSTTVRVPQPAQPARRARSIAVLVAVLLAAAALVAVGWWLGGSGQGALGPLPGAPPRAPDPLPVEGKVEEAPAGRAAAVEPEPGVAEEVAAPEAELDPATPPRPHRPRLPVAPDAAADSDQIRRMGSWEVEFLATGKASSDVTAILPAEPLIEGDHRLLPPALVLRCRLKKPSVVLRAGVEVDELTSERVQLEVSLSGSREIVQARVDPGIQNELQVLPARRWMARLLDEPEMVVFRFETPEREVYTAFRAGDTTAVRDALSDCLTSAFP